MGDAVLASGLGILSTSGLLALANGWLDNSVPSGLINDHGPSVCPGRAGMNPISAVRARQTQQRQRAEAKPARASSRRQPRRGQQVDPSTVVAGGRHPLVLSLVLRNGRLQTTPPPLFARPVARAAGPLVFRASFTLGRREASTAFSHRATMSSVDSPGRACLGLWRSCSCMVESELRFLEDEGGLAMLRTCVHPRPWP